MGVVQRLREWIDVTRTVRAVRKDRWLELMTIHVAALMTDPPRRDEHLFANHLQTEATEAERAQISQELATEL
jgi:hypothetical protein